MAGRETTNERENVEDTDCREARNRKENRENMEGKDASNGRENGEKWRVECLQIEMRMEK